MNSNETRTRQSELWETTPEWLLTSQGSGSDPDRSGTRYKCRFPGPAPECLLPAGPRVSASQSAPAC